MTMDEAPERDEAVPGAGDEQRAAQPEPLPYRAGFVAVVGRPNTGKSTLTNALVGEKIAITSSRPQTTRHAIRGVVNRPTGQLILVDTPGFHRPRTLLGERLNDLVRETLLDVDVIVLCLPADEAIGPGDRFIAREIAEARGGVPGGTGAPHGPALVAAVTKIDLVSRAQLAEHLAEISAEFAPDEIVPVSAVKDRQVDEFAGVVESHLPPSPQLYPEDMTTEEDQETLIAEFIREAALEGVRDELPHSLAVVVDEIAEVDPDGDPFAEVEPGTGRLTVRASIYVERDSQKGIVIGRGGRRLKQVGSDARKEIQHLLGRGIYLDIRVKVAKDWQRDPKQLDRLGFSF